MHVIPQLRKLERKFDKELVVIGVHSAKFASEKETDNIRQAILRYGIKHPVVNDDRFAIWTAYGVHAWPTIVVIDPLGRIVASLAGEFSYEQMERFIGGLVSRFDARGLIQHSLLHFEEEKLPDLPLSFPGKMIADDKSQRLFISDTNHNRIVVASLDRDAQIIIGSGKAGFRDGDLHTAEFNHPQGLALHGDSLFVADTENHAIRRVDLKARRVETAAGTGQQATGLHSGGPARTTPLNSPWDLVFHDGKLYIAMAGFHQLWVMDVAAKEIHPHAGSGREGILDGVLSSAMLAQPSGITTDGHRLYFADSETSSIRIADFERGGRVSTIVGTGLFDFGDRDGSGAAVRLQHPLGVAYHDGILYVADTYNNKIKQVIPATQTAVTFLGSGRAGLRDGAGEKAQFYEPGGLCAAGGKLYIADTNNHAVRVADLETKQVTTLHIKGLPQAASGR
jgi:sugar lactone lactonase YvrE